MSTQNREKMHGMESSKPAMNGMKSHEMCDKICRGRVITLNLIRNHLKRTKKAPSKNFWKGLFFYTPDGI
jgi:hypothetical protein